MTSHAVLKGWVHSVIDGAPVSYGPGSPVPDWVKNPALIEVREGEAPVAADPDAESTPSAPASTTTEPADDLAALSGAELKTIAADLGISTAGAKAAIADRIRAKRATATTENAPVGDDRAALEARATELGIEFDADTTDDELSGWIEETE